MSIILSISIYIWLENLQKILIVKWLMPEEGKRTIMAQTNIRHFTEQIKSPSIFEITIESACCTHYWFHPFIHVCGKVQMQQWISNINVHKHHSHKYFLHHISNKNSKSKKITRDADGNKLPENVGGTSIDNDLHKQWGSKKNWLRKRRY